MEKFGFIVDSTFNFSKEEIEKYNLSVANLSITIDSKNADNATNGDIVEALKLSKKVETSQPTPGSFLNLYKEKLKSFETIFVFTIGSSLSGSFNSANSAINLLENDEDKKRIIPIDSETATIGSKFIVEEIINLANKGFEFNDLLKSIDYFKSNGELYFLVDNLKTLKINGRLGTLKYFVARLLKIKPILKFAGNKLEITNAAVLGISKAKKNIIAKISDKLATLKEGKKLVITCGTVDNFDLLNEFYLEIKENFPTVNIRNCGFVSQIIASHVGPGGLGFYLNFIDNEN